MPICLPAPPCATAAAGQIGDDHGILRPDERVLPAFRVPHRLVGRLQGAALRWIDTMYGRPGHRCLERPWKADDDEAEALRLPQVLADVDCGGGPASSRAVRDFFAADSVVVSSLWTSAETSTSVRSGHADRAVDDDGPSMSDIELGAVDADLVDHARVGLAERERTFLT